MTARQYHLSRESVLAHQIRSRRARPRHRKRQTRYLTVRGIKKDAQAELIRRLAERVPIGCQLTHLFLARSNPAN